MKTKEITGFGAAVTSIDPRDIPANAATDMLNVDVEAGTIKPRYGFQSIEDPITGFASAHGAAYLQGYNASYAEVEEYVTAERKDTDTSGKCRIYTRDKSTGAATVMTNGASGVELANGEPITAIAFQDKGYVIAPADTNTVHRFTLGTTNTLEPMSIPVAPTVQLTFSITYGGQNTPYSTQAWTSATSSGTGAYASGTVAGDGGYEVTHTVDTTGLTSVTIEHAAAKDWTYNDNLAFTLIPSSTAFSIDPASVEVRLLNADGTAKTLLPTETEVLNTSEVTTGLLVNVRFYKKTRADFDNIKKLYISYNILTTSGTSANCKLWVSPVTLGGVDVQPYSNDVDLTLAYSYYDSTRGQESGIGGTVVIENALVEGRKLLPIQSRGMGVHIEVTFTASANANVDNFRLYAHHLTQNSVIPKSDWHRIVTQADNDTTYDYKWTWSEVLDFDTFEVTPFQFENIKGAFAYKGSVVWLYKGGFNNVRFSRVGEPDRQADTENADVPLDEDATRGRTMSLAQNYADEPLCGFDVGDACLVMGNTGAYASVGAFPFEMTPFKKLPGSFGCVSKFGAVRWKDDQGNPGVAAISQDGQSVHFYRVDQSFDGENGGFFVDELTTAVRGLMKSFLLDGQSALWTSLSVTTLAGQLAYMRIWVDEFRDALWVMCGKRAMVLRRPSLVTGARGWELYEYTIDGVFLYPAVSTKRRMRVLRSSGDFDEIEYDQANEVYITGSSRDDGAAMPTPYWTSKVFTGKNRRADHLYIERDDYSETPVVQVTSTRATNSYTWDANKRFKRTKVEQQGFEHKFKITLGETHEPYRRFTWNEIEAGLKLNT